MSDPLPLSADAAEAADPDVLFPSRYALERGLLVIGDRTEVLLVRHAQQIRTSAETKRPGGPSLSDLGRFQAELTGQLIARDGDVDAVYCSDLNRAVETAGVIGGIAHAEVEPVVLPELREVDMYGRDGGNRDISVEVQERAGAEFMRTGRFDVFPDTEPSEALRARIHRAVSDLVAKHRDGRIVVVSHGGAISAFIAHVIGARPDMFFYAGHASLSRVFYDEGRFAPHTMNETAHLRERGALTY